MPRFGTRTDGRERRGERHVVDVAGNRGELKETEAYGVVCPKGKNTVAGRPPTAVPGVARSQDVEE